MSLKLLGGALFFGALTAGHALAADLPPEIQVPELDMKEVTVASARGWYFRVDGGYTLNDDHHHVSTRNYDAATGSYDGGAFDKNRLDTDFSGDLGIGYQFNDLLRADVTGDLFSGDFNGRFDDGTPCTGESAGTTCRTKGHASFTAGSLMANGYFDVGTVAGFTPYLGAGLGATRIKWNDFHGSSNCLDGTSACTGTGGTDTSYSGKSDWRFTYALMAGVSYQVAANIKVDLGYRFSHVASGDMFGYSDADQAAGASGTMSRQGSLNRQEIRIGLRISTW